MNITSSSHALLWSDMVEQQEMEGRFLEKNGDKTINHADGGGSEVKEKEPAIDQVDPTQGSKNKVPLAAGTSKPKNSSQASGPIKTTVPGDGKEDTSSQKSPKEKKPPKGKKRNKKIPSDEISQKDSSTQESASDPKEQSGKKHERMKEILDLLKSVLQKKNLLLTQAKEQRIAAEEDCVWFWERLSEAERSLDEERQRRATTQKEIQKKKERTENVHQESDAHKLALAELEELKRQVNEKVSANLQLAKQLRRREKMTDDLEWKVAELRLKLRLKLKSSGGAPEIQADVSEPESSVETKVETQEITPAETDDSPPEHIPEPQVDSNQQPTELGRSAGLDLKNIYTVLYLDSAEEEPEEQPWLTQKRRKKKKKTNPAQT